jgi:nicotinate-nucleotide adenylyltransferase
VNTPVIGLFGGTFDPIHQAHLRMAHAFAHDAALSELHLIPAGDPYHRSQQCDASAQHRLQMVKLAIADDPVLRVDDREIRRGKPSYTIETLEEVRSEIGSASPLWFLIGSDSLQQLDRWQRWRELFDLAHLAVAIRPGFSEHDLPRLVREQWLERQVSAAPNLCASGTILRLALPPLDLSASTIRDGLARDADISQLVTPAIASYIREHGLYRKGNTEQPLRLR